IAWMAGLERDTDFTLRLEATDAGPMSGPRIDDDERSLLRIDADTVGRRNANEPIVHWSPEMTAVDDKLVFELQYIRSRLRNAIEVVVAPLPHHVPEQHRALAGIDPIGPCIHQRSRRPRHSRKSIGPGNRWAGIGNARWYSGRACFHKRPHSY